MGIYLSKDVETDDGARIQIENGDLKLGSARRSHLQVLHWLIATERGGDLNGDAVADLGAWVGAQNVTRVHRSMETQVRRALQIQGVFAPGDIYVHVVPVDLNSVAVTARAFGSYLEEDIEDFDEGYDTLAYHYVIGTGQLVKISEPDPHEPSG